MAKYSNTIEYNIITKLNSSGISQLQTQLKQLELSMQKFSNQKLLSERSVYEARTQLQGLSSALTKSFNPSLGMLDLTKFNTQLKESGVSAQGLTKAFNLGGAQGQVALNNLTAQIGKFNTGIERSSSTVDKMFNTIQNTFRWGLVSSAFSQFMNMIHQSVDYVKDLDSSLTQIMLVTDYSREQMQEYAKSANEAAKALGNTTTGMTNASLVFAQQGYNIQDSQKLAESSVKLANASQQDTATTSDQITAYMNAYGLDMHTGELNKALDSWAEVANVSAADVAELAGASQKAASSAKAMGVSTDQLNAQIATIESVTRGAPEEIGNGLKTLYARFTDIKMGETVEGDVDLGKVTGTLDKIGVQVMDKMGNMRNVGDIMEDLMGVWQTLDDNAKKSAATTLAGKHQVDRFLALMNNPDMYKQYKGSSEDATGTLDTMNEKYVNSIEGKTKQFQATVEGLLSELLNPDAMYPLIDTFKGFLEIVKELVKSLGGGQTILAGVAALFTRIFGKNIAQTVNNMQANAQIANIQKNNLTAQRESLEVIGAKNSPLMPLIQYGIDHSDKMTSQGREDFNEILSSQTKAENDYTLANQKLQDDVFSTAMLGGGLLGIKSPILKMDDDMFSPFNIMESFGGLDLHGIVNKIDDEQFKELGRALEDYGIQLRKVKEYEDAFFSPNINAKEKDQVLKGLKKSVTDLEKSYKVLNTVTEGEAGNTDISGAKKIVDTLKEEREKGFKKETKDKIEEVALPMIRVGSDFKEGRRTKADALNAKGIEEDQLDKITKRNVRDAARKNSEGWMDTQKAMEQKNSFIQLTSALSELTFAWQSFQSIGSIWSNKDMEPGEKFLRIITDLGFAIPTLINGIKTMKDNVQNIDWGNIFDTREGRISDLENLKNQDMKAWDKKRAAAALNDEDYAALQGEWELADQKEQAARAGLKNKNNSDSVNKGHRSKLKNAWNEKKGLEDEMAGVLEQNEEFQNLTDQMEKASKGYDKVILKNKVFGKVAETANNVTSALGEGLNSLTGVLAHPAVGLGLAVGGAIISGIQSAMDNARAEANEAFDEAKADFENTQTQITEFKDLYETWKKTGKGTDELETKGMELSKSLEVVGGQALAAAGSFDQLKESIDRAADNQLTDTITKASAAMTQNEHFGFLNTDSIENIAWQTGGLNDINPKGNTQSGENSYNNTVGTRMRDAGLVWSDPNKGRNIKDADQAIGDINGAIQITRQRIQELSNAAEGSKEAEERDHLQNTTLKDLESAASQENVQKRMEAAETRANARIKQSSFQDKINAVGQNQGEMWNLFRDDADTASYFKSLGLASKQNEFIAQNVTDPTLKNKFTVGMYEESLKEKGRAVDTSLFGNMSDELKIKYLSKLDSTDIQEGENINDILQGFLSDKKLKIQFDTEAAKESMNDVWQAMAEDKPLGREQLENVVSEDIKEAFNAANDAQTNESFKDVYSLLEGETLDAQVGAMATKGTIDAKEFSNALDEIHEKYNLNEEEAKAFGDISEEGLRAARKGAEELEDGLDGVFKKIDEAEDAGFNLDIDLGGDLIDQADGIVEAMGDVEDATSKIGDNFLVAADDVRSLEKAFPGILEGAYVTADGMIQLNEDVAQSAMGAATEEGLSYAEAQAQKLESYAAYADAMADEYQRQAIAFAEASAGQVKSNEEANAMIASADDGLKQYREQNLQGVDAGVKTAAENQGNYFGDAADAGAEAMAQGATSSMQSLDALTRAGAEAANSLINSFNQVATAVANSGSGQQTSASASGGIQTTSTEATKVQRKPIESGTTITVGGAEYKPTANNEGNRLLASAALEYQAKADAYRGAAGQARGAALQLRANAAGAGQAISNAGRSSGGSGGGGGGGGGSEKAYDPKQKEYIEEEVDLYERVNTQLDKVDSTLKGIQQETDRLIGPKAHANMTKQLKLLQREIDLQNEKLRIQQKERDDLRNELNGYGVTFDSEGLIANYADVLKNLEGHVNDLINQYNANGTEEGQEQLDNEIESAKTRLDKFKDLYKRYDELQGKEIQDTLNEIEELKDSIEDLRIEAYKAAQEALDELKEIRDSWTELEGFFSGRKLDSPFRNIGEDVGKLENVLALNKNKIAKYYDEIIRKNQELANSAKDAEERQAALDYVEFFTNERAKALGRTAGEGGAGLLGLSVANLEQLTYWKKNNSTDTPFGEDQAALVEALEDAYNRTKDLLLEAEENIKQLEEDIINEYDEIAEKMERHLTRYQRITDGLEHVADMISLTTGEEAYSELSAVYGQMAQTSLEQAKVQKSLVNWWQAALDGIKDKDSELYKAVEEHLNDAKDKLMEAQRATAENFQKEYENAVQKVLANMNKKILGVSNIDRVTDDWERDKEYASRYYDDVQKANHVEQLRMKYLNLLDDAQNASLDIQRKIRDSMGEQVGYLQDQAHLSEFNVRYANAQLEILQKQLALEDARNNKNQMRLRRDTQGNYKYVYAANQDDIRQKESDLLQSEMDAYDMSTQNRMDVYSQWIAAYQQYQQRYAELQKLAASQNEQVAQEARDALVKLEADFARDMKAYSEELNDSWEGMMGALSWMAETGTDTIKDSAEIAMDAIREKTDESLSAVGIQWNETIDGAIEDIDGLLDTAVKAWAEIDNATITYATNIKTEVNSLIDEGFGNLSGCLTNAADETYALRDATNKLKQALDNDNQSLQNAQTELANYRDALADTKNAASVTANALRNAQSELDKTKMENLALQGKLDDIAAGYRDQWGNIIGGGEGGSQWNGDVEEAAWGIARNIWTYGSWGNDPDRHSRIAERFGEAVANRAQEVINGHWWTGELVDYGSDIWGYATGGYTGTWADGSKDTEGGKLALLHQKELVLNAQDTENVLQAVNLVRQMTDALKGSFEIGSMVQKGTQVNKLGQDTIEQRVEITAEFPNVHNSDDIRNALLDLSNSAFQYSYKEV